MVVFRFVYISITALLLAMVLLFINRMINDRIESIKKSTYTRVADSMKEAIRSQIEDKQNGTFAIALGLSDNREIIRFLKTGKNPKDLRAFSKKLQQHTDYHNVWFQLVDKNGISRYRTWTDKTGDSLLEKRLDVQEMIQSPHIMNTISVGIFSMTFKSLVPVYDNETFIGSLETITHFNSIDRNLRENAIESVILVDKHYRPQLTRAITRHFIDDYYLVNGGAGKHLLEKIERDGVSRFLETGDYMIADDCLTTLHTIQDEAGGPMGYFILCKRLEKIDLTSLTSFEHSVKLAVPLGIILIITAFLLTIAVRRARMEHKNAELLEAKVRSRTKELQDLNRHLEERVNEESEKRRHQEQQLIHQEKLASMGQMLTNISHHWRQPLNVLALNIQDFAEANEFGELDEAYIKDNVARSMKQIRYMSDTINNFIHFFDEKEKGRTYFPALDAFREIATLLRPELEQKGITLQLPTEELLLHGNEGEFKQVCLNAVNNAVEAIIRSGRTDGMVRVVFGSEDDDIVITITDNGGGIDETIIGKIFDPYFTTKFKSKGVGISLYMSKMIIENNLKGSCRIDNMDDGACFTLRLPKD